MPAPHLAAPLSPEAPSRAEVAPPRPAPPPAARRSAAPPTLDLAQEYTHIRGDLMRLALVGGGILLVLVVLSLIIG